MGVWNAGASGREEASRSQQAPEQAQVHLRAALRRDARWLFNRGVLTFCVRQAFQHSAQAGPA